jgi:phosphatidylinositol-3-phosphatase
MTRFAVLVMFILAAVGLGGGAASADEARTASGASNTLKWPAGLPVYDHVVIVVEENKGYEQIIGNPAAAYINDVLKKEGANFTRAYAEEHFSEGNYFWMFSGDNQNVGYKDRIPSAASHPAYPFTAANLGQQLIARGLSFKGYAESLPAIGFSGDYAGLYARKHVPWISFANVPNGTSVATSSNLRFADFPASPARYPSLPTVAFVIPNQGNDMHNGRIDKSIPAGDAWLKRYIDPYYQWAKDHNSLLILTFDENDDKYGYFGLTDPAVDPRRCAGSGHDREDCIELQNRIVAIFAGAHIKPGDYPEGRGITHVTILRTLEAMYGLSKAGRQQPRAAAAGIGDDDIVTDVFSDARR